MKSKFKWRIFPKVSNDLKVQLLYNRGVISSLKKVEKEVQSFLQPDTKKDLFDPFRLRDLEKAAKRIIQASKNKEKVGIFGDYDADGIPGAAFLSEAFKKLGLKTLVYIPSRSEGYGFSPQAVNYFSSKGVKLIVVVDAGIKDLKACRLAKKLGIDVIICDHHETGRVLPQALAVIDPKRKDEKYPFRELSGAAVAFKLIQGISRMDKRISNDFLRWSLDLMAISVIFDMVPLISENRVLAKFGLRVLQKTKRVGLQELIKISGLESDTIDAYRVGFILAPRINAPGRIYNPQTSFKLLTTQDRKEACRLAQILDGVNRERQRQTERFVKEALKQIEKNKLHRHKIILVQDKEWPSGLVGLIASKLKETFNRPVFVLQRGEKTARGSARSIDGFHLVEALAEVKDFIIKGGGHAKAAGVELALDKVEEFYEKLLQLAEEKIKEEDLLPVLEIDAILSFKDIDFSFWQLMQDFEPFGMGNPKPLFLTQEAEVVDLKTMGNGNRHLSIFLQEGGQVMRAVYFNGGDLNNHLSRGQKVDLVYSLICDNYAGRPKVELKIQDLKIGS
ncbi:single-stranded-DNA-specific exonuclease RecJ [bacterium]|nr:single-stranded-DNA-specific exonuclease RecJ [bacterium]